ncbi:hypothetical protein BJV78DRAFT_1153359 [Lactifluus subvellereus]|nr:hypothetical protein BJV78DRAFT_1153359 [Lactifluus subvellereus]
MAEQVITTLHATSIVVLYANRHIRHSGHWAHPFDKKLEDRPIESDPWDDAEILRRLDDSEGISPDAPWVRKISDDTLVKGTLDMGAPHLEASSFELVRMHTTIPIPRIRPRIKDEDGYTFIVTDYIPGERLDHVWPSLSLVQDSHSSVPGPVADSPQICDGYIFGKPCGPFPDYASLSVFFNRKLDIAKDITYPDCDGNTIRCARPDCEPFDDSRPLVFTHSDLSMRNIIFGRDGRIWLVDWGMSGFYLPWFEYVSTVYAAGNDSAPDSWNRLIPFIADPLFKHMKWIDQLGVALIAYR